MFAKTLSHALLIGFLAAGATLGAPRIAEAAPGTCKCNNGCHGNPGQCIQGNGCSIGYAPSCGVRISETGVSECPKAGYISCNGTCICTPIPGYCETIGGAEFCDAGPPDTGTDTGKDSSVPDTSVADTFGADTFVADTFVADTFVADTFVADTFVADTFVADTFVDDTFVADTFVADTFVPDSCVPLECPPGTSSIAVPGQCDPFCAQPCGAGEFKCSGLVGTECKSGFCVPKCLTSGCPDCKRCSLGDGLCFDDDTACDAGAPDGSSTDGAVTDGSGGDGTSGDGTVGEDTGGSGDGTVEDTGANVDGSTSADTGEVFGNPDELAGDTGGCGCSVPGTENDNGIAAFGAAAGLALVLARRRRK